ncbi:hypothetical protein CLV58_109155 [Spirosoma oryzae]|uniref:Uncharacterized protein n=1 Tax=Spirosoma oryzae TaxID=1469603 RepID=A0A2T0SYD7_9BACT|nr:hypothetical protein [Spirosoma oryzae]PRY38428.1 hypothetical protein CLV58_109155 [Spirosoma oryzae]
MSRYCQNVDAIQATTDNQSELESFLGVNLRLQDNCEHCPTEVYRNFVPKWVAIPINPPISFVEIGGWISRNASGHYQTYTAQAWQDAGFWVSPEETATPTDSSTPPAEEPSSPEPSSPASSTTD